MKPSRLIWARARHNGRHGMNAVILEREYPMAYTVAAQSEIAARFGGIEHIQDAFDDTDSAKTMENMAFCAACLMRGYAQRETVRRKTMGQEAPELPVLTQEEIAAAILVNEVKNLTQAIMQTIREGNAVTVEVEPKKGKNAKATQ